MKMKKRYGWGLIVILIVGYFGPSAFGGYYWTEHAAIWDTFPNQSGEVVAEKEFGTKKLIIWDSEPRDYVKLIEKHAGLLYRAADITPMDVQAANGDLRVTWSATEMESGMYEVIFAAEVLDEEIEKVIVSKEEESRESIVSSNERAASAENVVEIEVEKGYAIHYTTLPAAETGDFVFQGIDAGR
ncbi:hypothetical protein ACFOGI_11060 [Virgibacillus xinjiangensis]|uniref:Uncharacterized protein n=1 Tax=Virgibacillus xinjiangensis TaxID=393090 RepID=A0ABV7CWU2_9BACI